MKDIQQLQLVQRIQLRDAGAEQELFRQYKDPILWKVLKSIQTGREDINDIASEVYLAILEGIRKESFQPERWESLEAYIWGVTHNKIRDWFRKRKRETEIFHGDPPSEEISAAVNEHFLENKEMAETIRVVLEKLPLQYQEVLKLRYLEELSLPETGKHIGLATPRVSERINYAVKLLRKEWKKRKMDSIFAIILLLSLWMPGMF